MSKEILLLGVPITYCFRVSRHFCPEYFLHALHVFWGRGGGGAVPRQMVKFNPGLSQILSKVFLSKNM